MNPSDQSTAMLEEPDAESDTAKPDSEESQQSLQAVKPLDDALARWADILRKRSGDSTGALGLPVLPDDASGAIDASAQASANAVRHFYNGTAPKDDTLDRVDDQIAPALLFPFWDQTNIRHDYPLVLLPVGSEANGNPCQPLAELLKDCITNIAPDDAAARILKDNVARLEQGVCDILADAPEPVCARETLTAAASALVEDLGLDETNADALEDDLKSLVEAVPDKSTLLALGIWTMEWLFIHAAQHRANDRRSALQTEIQTAANRIADQLCSDDARREESRDPDSLRKSVGTQQIDPSRLSNVVASRSGPAPMTADRRTRLKNIHETLQSHLAEQDSALITILHQQTAPESDRLAGVNWLQVGTNVCTAAISAFEQAAKKYAAVFGALRAARLELAGTYDPARHDSLLDSFRWDSFSRDELLYMPPIAAVESMEDLAGSGMIDLSRLLLSGMPVDVLVHLRPSTSPGLSLDESLAGRSRFELAYLGIGHRQALVSQTSAARPMHLMQGFMRTLDQTSPGLHVTGDGRTSANEVSKLGEWFHAGAALEGRAHPFFHYDPEAGSTWARRFDFTDNPQPDADWATYALPCQSADGEESSLALAFTFADFALLDTAFNNHFRVVPEDCPADTLVPIDEFLALETTDEQIPFLWAVDEKRSLRRVVVSHAMVDACRDRLSYWRTLQELAGIRNEYVQEAVAAERDRAEADFAAKRDELQATHTAEVERVRAETAAQVMEQLAQKLLNVDPGVLNLTAAPTAAPPAPAAPTDTPPEAAAPATEEAPAEADEEDDGPDEAWIESILCTTCNDCMDINAQVFVYNANKQAVIGDPNAGTFKDLVLAAEKCPANCIHPGKPQDASEPNLDDLVNRAKPYN